jgi:hypothetical protein
MRNQRTEKGPNSKLGWNSRDTAPPQPLTCILRVRREMAKRGLRTFISSAKKRCGRTPRFDANKCVYPTTHLPAGIGLKCRTCGWPRKHAHGPASYRRQDHALFTSFAN